MITTTFRYLTNLNEWKLNDMINNEKNEKRSLGYREINEEYESIIRLSLKEL